MLDVKKWSGVTQATHRTHKVALPRLGDAPTDALELSEDLQPDEVVEFLVLDFQDAFWNIPLRMAGRRFFVGKCRGLYLVYLRGGVATLDLDGLASYPWSCV